MTFDEDRVYDCERADISHRREGRTHTVIKIRSILVPLDFSETSLKALVYAASLAAEFEAEITLLYVMEPVSLPEFAGAYPVTMENDELVTACKLKLANCAGKFAIEAGLIKESIIRRGPADREITQLAHEMDADLIVIATHGYSGWRHAMLGSVTERVVQHAPCPVLVVREKEHEFVSS
jgi:universal stress protein A